MIHGCSSSAMVSYHRFQLFLNMFEPCFFHSPRWKLEIPTFHDFPPTGWWLGHPSEKYGPSIGMMTFPIYGKILKMATKPPTSLETLSRLKLLNDNFLTWNPLIQDDLPWRKNTSTSARSCEVVIFWEPFGSGLRAHPRCSHESADRYTWRSTHGPSMGTKKTTVGCSVWATHPQLKMVG